MSTTIKLLSMQSKLRVQQLLTAVRNVGITRTITTATNLNKSNDAMPRAASFSLYTASKKPGGPLNIFKSNSMQSKLRLLMVTLSVILLSFVTTSVFGQKVATDKRDYFPGDVVLITGSGWQPGENVSLNIVSDCGCTNVLLTATADGNGNIFNNTFLITEAHLHTYFSLVAEGSSDHFAETYFTDATINTGGSGNWSSTAKNAPWPGTGSTGTIPANTDDLVIGSGHTLTVDGDRTCNSIILTDGATLIVNPGVILTVTTSVILQNSLTSNSSATISGTGTINAASIIVVNQDGNGGVGDFSATLNLENSNFNISGNVTINSNQGNSASGIVHLEIEMVF
jgi:hypothetical protein